MQSSLLSRPRRRRVALAGLAFALVAVVAPTVGSSPAGAVTAPLATTDGVGIRVDENALLGPALEAIETAMQPFVNDMVRQGAIDGAPLSGYHALYTSNNLELNFDFVNAGVSGYPSGGLKVHADILNIDIQYRRDAWWHSDCGVWVDPDNATIDASAKINAALLPAAPLQLNPIAATWDDDPAVSTSGACWTYLIDDFFSGWWDAWFGSPTSTARQIEAELNDVAQDLVNDLWTDHVTPVINSLTGFGVTINQLRTDDHGLIVTANVNATGGVTLPGIGGPFDVTNAEDSGVTTNVNTLLANRGEIIATIHPNVVNQFLYAINFNLSNQYGTYPISSSIETVLLNPADRALYSDTAWTVRLTAQAAPYTLPTGTGGAPQMKMPAVTVRFFNGGPLSIATFTGSLDAINLVTQVRSPGTNWGPAISSTNAVLTATRTQANTHAAQVAAQPASAILPYAKIAIDGVNTGVFVGLINLPPISIGGLNVTICTACGRYSGDQRYTETFNIA